MLKQLFVALSVFAFAAGAAIVPAMADEPAEECVATDENPCPDENME